MMTRIFSTFATLLLLGFVAPAECGNSVRHLRTREVSETPNNQAVTCKVQVFFAMLDEIYQAETSSSSHEVVCGELNGNHGQNYVIVGPNSHTLMEYASLEVSLAPVIVNHTSMTVHIADNFTIETLQSDSLHRALQERPSAIGNRSVLALRVSFMDSEPSFSSKEMSELLFGPDEGSITMRSQFAACSFDKLQMNPAVGDNILNGVGELTVPKKATELVRWAAEQVARVAAEAKFGDIENEFDHVMFCMPPGINYSAVREDWAAYAYLRSSLSFYNDMACLYVSVPMHELGHNFGLGHSNFGTEYNDDTGSMGRAYAHLGGPRRCFNAEKNYLLGWYSDRVAEVNVMEQEQAWKGTLVAFPDYDKAEANEVVNIRINGALDNRGMPRPHFVQFNRAKGFHNETLMLHNMIVTVKGYSSFRTGLYGSYVVPSAGGSGIALDTNEWRYSPSPPRRQRIGNFADSGYALVIDVCSQEYGDKDYAVMSIHLDDGIQQSACLSPTPEPSTQPTSAPSSGPTPNPTSSPNGLCEDNPNDKFVVNRIWGEQDCLWLGTKKPWQQLLCSKEGHPVRTSCPATCKICDEVDIISPNARCDDKQNTAFHVNNIQGYRTCSWLAQSAVWQKHLCKRFNFAYHVCEETCGKCRDVCEDSATSSFIVDQLGGVERKCAWLAIRPAWQRVLCQDETVSNLCQESCDSCKS